MSRPDDGRTLLQIGALFGMCLLSILAPLGWWSGSLGDAATHVGGVMNDRSSAPNAGPAQEVVGIRRHYPAAQGMAPDPAPAPPEDLWEELALTAPAAAPVAPVVASRVVPPPPPKILMCPAPFSFSRSNMYLKYSLCPPW